MANRPRLLDLFCGAGGCARGYADAGFEVVGVDNVPQLHYPFEFHLADALTFPLDGFDVIHASPPCQGYTMLNHLHKNEYPRLFGTTRERLQASGKPYVIENVIGAPIEQGVMLCGSMFGLQVLRHRWFESNFILFSPGACLHKGQFYGIYGHNIWDYSKRSDLRAGVARQFRPISAKLEYAKRAMGITWMNRLELCQAIPPAYTEWIGQQLIQHVQSALEVPA